MLAFTKDSAAPEFRTLLRGQSCKAQLYVKYANQANTFMVTLTIPFQTYTYFASALPR